ncbi:MAG: nucleoside triphosphate pyrophosphohydrolase [Bacillota bacterium]
MRAAPKIYIVGLGPGDWRTLTLGAMETLRSIRPLVLRTAVHPTVEYLVQQGIQFETFDGLYERGESFESIYAGMVDKLVSLARHDGQVCFAVPGHPLVAEKAALMLIEQAGGLGVDIVLNSGLSCIDAMAEALAVDPSAGLVIQDALDYRTVGGGLPQLIMQVYNRRVASDLKLTLADAFGDEIKVVVVRAAGIADQERVVEIPLYELDRLDWLDHLTSLFVPAYEPVHPVVNYAVDPLTDVMARLRAPDGCPWDRKQTHESLRPYVIEEAYEVVEAIDLGDAHKVCEELGDLLLQIVFHSQIAQDAGSFDFNDVVQVITEKLIRRHPHVFGDWEAETPEQVTINWDKIKAREREEKGEQPSSLLQAIGKGLPGLMRALKLQAKAATVGFDWDSIDGAWQKVHEELQELIEATRQGEHALVEAELGDLLFAVVNLARFLKVDPEVAVLGTCEKFQRRFAYIESRAQEQGLNLNKMTLSEMDAIWNEAKRAKL